MGLLVDGVWHDEWYDTSKTGGSFQRWESPFRSWVTRDGSAGPTGEADFKAEAGRYHLYVSYACPWAHRTLIYRKLKGLEDAVDVSVVHWLMRENGWTFESDAEGIVKDNLFGACYLHQIYTRADAKFSGRVTVPVLWDKKHQTIVSNESSEIIRMFNSAFVDVGATGQDYYPADLRKEIDDWNEVIYANVNNGVYRAGFASSQVAYDEAVRQLFETLEKLESRLANRRFLLGSSPTEADWRLLPTLLRFDPIYHGHFKCNLKRLIDYPNLWGYTRDLYQWPAIANTYNAAHAKRHYYESHIKVNPTGIVPFGPILNLDEPHDRHRLNGA